jgi:hypothetical protein
MESNKKEVNEMKIWIAIFCVFLAACNPIRPCEEQPVATKYKYIVTEIPETMLVVPANVNPIDTKTATDKDAAKWMIESEKRSKIIEQQLKAIKQYQEDRLKLIDVPKTDIIKN